MRKIYIRHETEIKKYGPTMVPCIHCFTNHCSTKARENNRVGFCGKRCKRYHEKKSSKWKNGKDRNSRQLKRNDNLKEELGFFLSRDWRELRFKILRKYGFCCMACGARPPSVVLHVDHIKPRSKFPHLEMSADNLQVLCAACNQGKSNLFEDDLRPKQ